MSARTVLVCNTCAAVEGLTPPADTYTTRRTLKPKGWVYWRREARTAAPSGYVEPRQCLPPT